MYRITISDGTVLSDCVDNVAFEVITPDDYDGRRRRKYNCCQLSS